MNLHAEIKLERIFELSCQQLWQCWLDPEQLQHFFVPRPCVLEHCDIQPTVGGRFNTRIDVEGHCISSQGIILQMDEMQRLVLTDSYREGWVPNSEPFLTLMLNFNPLGDYRTLCQLTAHHRSGQDIESFMQHDFQLGWQKVFDQLSDYTQQLQSAAITKSRRTETQLTVDAI